MNLQLVSDKEALAEALIDREHDVEQHTLVMKTLEAQDADRKAWRLVGDVLVERTVAEVLPEVEKNRDNLAKVAANYRKQLEAKQKEIIAFQEKYKMNTQARPSGAQTKNEKAQQSSGVLVSNE